MQSCETEIVLDNDIKARLSFLAGREMLERYSARTPSARNLLDEQELWHEVRQSMSLAIVRHNEIASEALFGSYSEIPPVLTVWEASRRVFCGLDKSLMILDWERPSVDCRRLDWPFLGFVWSSNKELLLCVEELGLKCFDQTAKMIWDVGTAEIIEHVEISGDIVKVSELSRPNPYTLDLRTGKLSAEDNA